MNTLDFVTDKRKDKDTIVDELKRESGGSFSVVYRALREVSTTSGGSTSLSKADVLRAIHRIRTRDKATRG
jgi:hypothetical protein